MYGWFSGSIIETGGRESTLKSFKSYIEKGQESFVMGLEDTYTPDDWQWLINEVRKK